jgi:non-canonical purine NTP pyrophosphatase (RdgB/HAM1 family)
MRLLFVTTNRHKAKEVGKVLAPYGITVEQLDRSYDESHDDTIQDIARKAAKRLAEELKRPVMVEDTGIFFAAYPSFPGTMPKLAFQGLGYAGLLKLLEGKKGRQRAAYFLSCIAYCEPGGKPQAFKGRLDGTIIDHVEDLKKDVMPYERIFVPEGDTRTISKLTREEKNAISHRAQAARKLAVYLRSR